MSKEIILGLTAAFELLSKLTELASAMTTEGEDAPTIAELKDKHQSVAEQLQRLKAQEA